MKRCLVLSTIWLGILAPLFALGENRVLLLPLASDDFRARQQIVATSDVIYVSTYILREDRTGLAHLALMREATRQGKEVRLIVDGFGAQISPAMLDHLQREGVKIRIFEPVPWGSGTFLRNLTRPNRWVGRTHDKLFLGFSHGTTSITHLVGGSRNVGDEAFQRGPHLNEEFGLYLEGGAAEETRTYYESIWKSTRVHEPRNYTLFGSRRAASSGLDRALNHLKTDDLGTPVFSIGAAREAGRVDFIHDSPKDFLGSSKAMIKLIDSATTELHVTSPYFFPPRELELALKRAVRRGVKVHVVTNSYETNNQPLAYAAYDNEFAKLAKMGLILYETRGGVLLHKKIVIVDRKSAYVGSYNFDQRSEDKQLETGFVLSDPGLVAEVMADAARDFRRSERVARDGKILSGHRCASWGYKQLARALLPLL